MKFKDRARAAVAAFRGKSANQVELNNLMSALGIHNVEGAALSEATYFACLKVLSESIAPILRRIVPKSKAKSSTITKTFSIGIFSLSTQYFTALPLRFI